HYPLSLHDALPISPPATPPTTPPITARIAPLPPLPRLFPRTPPITAPHTAPIAAPRRDLFVFFTDSQPVVIVPARNNIAIEPDSVLMLRVLVVNFFGNGKRLLTTCRRCLWFRTIQTRFRFGFEPLERSRRELFWLFPRR